MATRKFESGYSKLQKKKKMNFVIWQTLVLELHLSLECYNVSILYFLLIQKDGNFTKSYT